MVKFDFVKYLLLQIEYQILLSFKLILLPMVLGVGPKCIHFPNRYGVEGEVTCSIPFRYGSRDLPIK